jgi:hypothetical protein
MPLTFVEQISAAPDAQGHTPKVWAVLSPGLDGLTLSLPAWSFFYAGKRIDLPATTLTLTSDATHPTGVRLYVVPTSDGIDNYHLDETVLDGVHQPVIPERFAEIGHMLLLWGTVPPGGADAELFCLRHVEV